MFILLSFVCNERVRLQEDCLPKLPQCHWQQNVSPMSRPSLTEFPSTRTKKRLNFFRSSPEWERRCDDVPNVGINHTATAN